MCVASNGLAKFSADQDDGILLVIALLVESFRPEAVLRRSEQPFHPLNFHGLAKDVIENFGMPLVHTEYLRIKKILALTSFRIEGLAQEFLSFSRPLHHLVHFFFILFEDVVDLFFAGLIFRVFL